jgi:hypothetical protein
MSPLRITPVLELASNSHHWDSIRQEREPQSEVQLLLRKIAMLRREASDMTVSDRKEVVPAISALVQPETLEWDQKALRGSILIIVSYGSYTIAIAIFIIEWMIHSDS